LACCDGSVKTAISTARESGIVPIAGRDRAGQEGRRSWSPVTGAPGQRTFRRHIWKPPAVERVLDQDAPQQEAPMARLRERWLETLATCVTVVLLGVVYIVLVEYDTGRSIAGYHALMHIADR
jgi:hypothetical protein